MDRRGKIQKIISLLLEEEPEYRQQAAEIYGKWKYGGKMMAFVFRREDLRDVG